MAVSTIVTHIVVWGIIGGIAMTVFVLLQHTTGIAHRIHGQVSSSREEMQALAIRLFVITVILLFGVPLLASFTLAAEVEGSPSFDVLWGTAFSVVLLMHVWDFLIIDLLIILSIRPKSLAIPDTEFYRSVTPHLKAFGKGVFLGLITSVAAAGIALPLT